MKWLLATLLLVLNDVRIQSQIRFQANWDHEKLVFGKYYPISEKDSLRIDELKFYVSNFHFYGNTKSLELKEPQLIDLSENGTSTLFQGKDLTGFQKMNFLLGLDSIVNTTDDFSGSLDPVNGMYWAWNSGYIAFKLTGSSNVITENKSQFEFHLGGYRQTKFASQTISLANHDLIIIDLKELLTKQIDLKAENHVLLPGKRAVLLMQKIATCMH